MTEVLSWLENKLIEGENGLILSVDDENFDTIQKFIEIKDISFKTPVIYFQGFSEENTIAFLQNLQEELMSKLNKSDLSSKETLEDIIRIAKLKMIIIDRCYLYSLDTLQNLVEFFAINSVATILVGSQDKIENTRILELPQISQWDKLLTGNF